MIKKINMISIKYTEDKSYIRITNPTSEAHNIGYISPSDGELSVKPELMEMINKVNLTSIFDWEKGCGRHDGSNYEAHSTNHLNIHCTIQFIKRVLELNNYKVEINLI